VRTITFTRPDGSQALVSIYDDGHCTLAERSAPHLVPYTTWGAPIRADLSDPYDYKVDESRFRRLLEQA
jgi:hypothetical protein